MPKMYKPYNIVADNKKFIYYLTPNEDTIPADAINYAGMSKRFLNKPMNSPTDIVGNYGWHEKYPYEKYLLQNTDILTLDNPEFVGVECRALDFGCGTGRMVKRMLNYVKYCDGCDVSEYALAYAKTYCPGSEFYPTSGMDVGDVPENRYDFIFSTISMQHIPVKVIRKNIIRGLYRALKYNGWMSIQMAYNPDYQAGVWSPDTEHAPWDANFYGAMATNGHADVVINKDDLTSVRDWFGAIFDTDKVEIFLDNVAEKFPNLEGEYHAPYWASHWIYITVQKKNWD